MQTHIYVCVCVCSDQTESGGTQSQISILISATFNPVNDPLEEHFVNTEIKRHVEKGISWCVHVTNFFTVPTFW